MSAHSIWLKSHLENKRHSVLLLILSRNNVFYWRTTADKTALLTSIIINIIITTFIQGIYTYIPGTIYVTRDAVLQLFCCYYSWCLYR